LLNWRRRFNWRSEIGFGDRSRQWAYFPYVKIQVSIIGIYFEAVTMNTINIPISLDALAQAIISLDWDDQQKLRDILEEQLFESEESWENSPEIMAEIAEAKKAYQQGEYQTLSEFVSE